MPFKLVIKALPPVPTIPKLSELSVDADKDWQVKGIYNLKEVSQGMGHGDLTFKSGQMLTKLPPAYGSGTSFLHMKSVGDGKFEPEWADIQDIIALVSGATGRIITAPLLSILAAGTSLQAAEDHSGGAYTGGGVLPVPVPGIGASAELM